MGSLFLFGPVALLVMVASSGHAGSRTAHAADSPEAADRHPPTMHAVVRAPLTQSPDRVRAIGAEPVAGWAPPSAPDPPSHAADAPVLRDPWRPGPWGSASLGRPPADASTVVVPPGAPVNAPAGEAPAPPRPEEADTRPTLVVSGFGRYAHLHENPSYTALEHALRAGWFDDWPVRVAIVQLPVVWARAFPVLQQTVRDHEPVVGVISLGAHIGNGSYELDGFYVERVARNYPHGGYSRDEAGQRRPRGGVVRGGPATIPTGLPVDAIVRALADDGFNVHSSTDASDFLCNHVFYAALHQWGDRFPCGFVHVPPDRGSGGRLSRAKLARGVYRLIEQVLPLLATAPDADGPAHSPWDGAEPDLRGMARGR